MNGRRASDSHPITGLIPNWKKPETSGIPGQREWKRPSRDIYKDTKTGEYDFDFNPTKEMDTSGRHDIRR